MAREAIDDDDRVHREYPERVRITSYRHPDLGERRWRFEAPLHDDATFPDPDLAELYADVYFAVGGFREEKSGERGVPPAVAFAGRPETVAYALTLPGVTGSVEWAAGQFGLEESTVRTYVSRVREAARERREDAREDSSALAEHDAVSRVVDDVAAEEWDDDGRRQQRREAALAAAEYLAAEGGASKQDVVDDVEPEHPVDGQDPRTWYRKTVRPVFNRVAEYDNSAREYVVDVDGGEADE
jgi:hypothetical protein